MPNSETTKAALAAVKFEEESNAMALSAEADKAAKSGDWRAANKIADESVVAYQSAENIGIVLSNSGK